MPPQPPPAKKTVDAGSAAINFALSKTRCMRDVPSGEESSIVTFSLASLPLTSDSASSAQFTLNCRPLSRLILWKTKSSRGCHFIYRGITAYPTPPALLSFFKISYRSSIANPRFTSGSFTPIALASSVTDGGLSSPVWEVSHNYYQQ